MLNSQRIDLVVPSITSKGGIQSYMLRLWEMLNEIPSADIACLSLNDRYEELVKEIPDSIERVTGCNKNKFIFIFHQLLRKQSNSLVIVGHLNFTPVVLLAKLLGRISGYIVILHGIEAWQRKNWLVRLAMSVARYNIATTTYTARVNARLNNIGAKKYKVIPLCSREHFQSSESMFRLKGEFPLLMVARLDASEKYKGMELVIDALARLMNMGIPAHFNLVGAGNDSSRIQAYAVKKGCDSNFTIWGQLNDIDLQAAYKSASIFVMPSKKEGFGIVFLEAMKHGLPCIGGNHGGTPEVITDGVDGFLIQWGDVNSLVNRLAMLWRRNDVRLNMGAAAVLKYNNQYTFTKFTRNWHGFLADIH